MNRPLPAFRPPLALLLLGLGLAGCVVGPDYQPPTPPELDAAFTGSSGSGPAGQKLDCWWQRLQDAQLNALVQEALEQNHDLQIAHERIVEASAMRRQARSALFPSANAKAGYTNVGISETTDEYKLMSQFGLAFDQTEQWNLGLDTAWEIDLFGGNRRRVEATSAQLDAAGERAHATQLALVSELVDAYYSLAGARLQLDRVRANIGVQTETVEQVSARLSEGLGNELDLRRANAQLAATQAAAPPFQAAVTAQLRRLSLLLGRKPTYLDQRSSSFRGFPEHLPIVTTGLTAELLVRRPDLRLAERELAVATAGIGVAAANFYPRFVLFGSPELMSATSGDLFNINSLAWQAGPRVEWSLFTGGRNKAILETANSQQRQALLSYEQAVLRAAGEVETALAQLRAESERLAALGRSVSENRVSTRLATQLYREGLQDFLSVLVEEQRLIQAEIAEVQSRTALLSAWVSLHRALGGGW